MSNFILRFFLSTLLSVFFGTNAKKIPNSNTGSAQIQLVDFKIHSSNKKFKWASNSIINIVFCKKMKKFKLDILHLSFNQWQKHLKNKIKFKFKGYKNKTTTGIFICTNSVWNRPPEVKNAQAETFLMGIPGSSHILKSEIFLNTKKYKYKGKSTLLQSIILHEIGHALGIIKHSNNIYSIMHKFSDDVIILHKEDIARIKKLYQI